MTDLLEIFIERGDLAHLALLLWAASASGLGWFALRELTAASRRFEGVRHPRRKEGAPVARSPFCGPPAS